MYHSLSWQLAGTIATAQFSFSRATLDLTQPASGVSVLHPALQTARFLQIEGWDQLRSIPAAEIEAYVRQEDLVATYASTDKRPNRLQLYWRLRRELPPGLQAACELIVSVNTPHWESNPRLAVVTSLPGVTACQQLDSVTICEQIAGTYVQMTHPGDFWSTDLTWSRTQGATPDELLATGATGLDGTATIRQPLFQHVLEKGVILRARMWVGWFSPGVSRADILTFRDEFTRSQLVLTA